MPWYWIKLFITIWSTRFTNFTASSSSSIKLISYLVILSLDDILKKRLPSESLSFNTHNFVSVWMHAIVAWMALYIALRVNFSFVPYMSIRLLQTKWSLGSDILERSSFLGLKSFFSQFKAVSLIVSFLKDFAFQVLDPNWHSGNKIYMFYFFI